MMRRNLFFLIFNVVAVVILGSAGNSSEPMPPSSPKTPSGPTTWSDVSIDKRCEGILAFLQSATADELPKWSILKPQCVIAGNANGDISWSLEGRWTKEGKALNLKYIVAESKTKKPAVTWCVVKAQKMACATPWATTFESGVEKGGLFATREEAAKAFKDLLKLSQGFVSVSAKLDNWVGTGQSDIKIYEMPYHDWIQGWTVAPRSLPLKDGSFVAEYVPDRTIANAGAVNFKSALPPSLRDCLGCPKTACEKSQVTYVFSGIGLTLYRDLTLDEQKTQNMKTAKMSWLTLEPTPFIGGVAKWPVLCGEHHFNVQKF